MKRLAALLLAALMALTAFSALADESYTLMEKFYQQAFKESAYQGTVTFAVTGTGSSLIDAKTWAALKVLAPKLSLSIEHATKAGKDEGQATAILSVSGGTTIKSTYMYDDKLMAFSSGLLGGENTYYAAARDWNLITLLGDAVQGDSPWPPMWRLISAIETAPQEWKNRARERISQYETKVGFWLNGYATFTTGRENNVVYSELSCTIPAQAVKAEIKQLMVDLYSDSALLTLLREIATPEEAAAYLQPAMMDTLFSLLDNLNLNGDVKVIRRYDTLGNALLDQMTLPFAEGGLLSEITVSVAPGEGGQTVTFTGSLNSGLSFDISCMAAEGLIYTGSVRLTLPEAQNAGFVVSEGLENRSVAFNYNLAWEPGEDEYTVATDRFTRTIRGTLLIRPAESAGVPEQSLTLEAVLSSKSSRRSSTQLNGTLTWRDMETDTSVSAILTSRTVSPIENYMTPSSLAEALRIDLMTDASRSALLQSWMQNAAMYGASLLLGGTGLTVPLATVAP